MLVKRRSVATAAAAAKAVAPHASAATIIGGGCHGDVRRLADGAVVCSQSERCGASCYQDATFLSLVCLFCTTVMQKIRVSKLCLERHQF